MAELDVGEGIVDYISGALGFLPDTTLPFGDDSIILGVEYVGNVDYPLLFNRVAFSFRFQSNPTRQWEPSVRLEVSSLRHLLVLPIYYRGSTIFARMEAGSPIGVRLVVSVP